MESIQYAAKMEKKLVDDFKKLFQEKLGYTPIVFTKTDMDAAEVPFMSLEELNRHFTAFLPMKFGEPLPMQTKLRIREIVELRAIFCYLAKNMKYSLKTIGVFLGGRDHTTVIHGLNTFRDLMETNDAFRQKFLTIHKHIVKETNPIADESLPMDHMLEVQHATQPAILP